MLISSAESNVFIPAPSDMKGQAYLEKIKKDLAEPIPVLIVQIHKEAFNSEKLNCIARGTIRTMMVEELLD